MNAEKPNYYHPIKFLDRMEGNNHIVLLYDSQKYAYLIIARYLLNGLKKGESCIFFTSDEPEAIEKRLSAEGIDINSYRQKNSLRIHPIDRSYANRHDALSSLKRIRGEATRGMKPPYRFVGRTIDDTGSKEGMKLGLVIEKTGHKHFDNFDCSQMCYYNIAGIEQSQRNKWIKELLKNHHHVIYAAEPDRAVAFETMLLEDEE
ncbi:MAG: MEDS domain-containing protein [Thermoproteota archaeon]|nr:MEDS domain-containing protein [Thermoproteota archaeon]MDQ3888112.1 MEDS domain-containing protein [Thermoproteota archaeon]